MAAKPKLIFEGEQPVAFHTSSAPADKTKVKPGIQSTEKSYVHEPDAVGLANGEKKETKRYRRIEYTK